MSLLKKMSFLLFASLLIVSCSSDSDDDTGASAYHYVDATGSLIGENPINRAEVYTGIYNNGKTGEDQYSDARVVLEAGLGANAMCSPCGSSIELFEIQSGGNESSRFIDCLSSHFFKIKRGDCLFIKDYSSPQRKYLYSLLESNGFDKKVLYRKFTTYPSRPK